MQLSRKSRERLFGYTLLVPAILILTLIIIIPLIEAVGYSFTDTSLISFTTHTFVGLKNYSRLLQDPVYWTVLTNTIKIVFISVLISLFLGVILALILNNAKGKQFLRGLFIIPWLIPGVVIGIVWKWVLATEAGIFNFILRKIGILESNFPFLSDNTVSLWVVIAVFVWSSVPYILVTTLAGLQAVPQDLEEAAIIDGANSTQRFFSIIVPVILPVISIAVVLRIIYTMQDFAIIFSLTQGGPGNATETFVLHVYKTAFNSAQIGKACAVGVTWMLFLLIFVIAYFKLIGMNEKK
ncbi:MAG: sugar ABC transporter permease [Spirochaetia bacterium]|nr:sugar ABC transporter permease [Spirochaetia bacterium]